MDKQTTLMNALLTEGGEKQHEVQIVLASIKGAIKKIAAVTLIGTLGVSTIWLVSSMVYTALGKDFGFEPATTRDAREVLDNDPIIAFLDKNKRDQDLLEEIESIEMLFQRFPAHSPELEFSKGFSWDVNKNQLPIHVSYDFMLQDQAGTILMALFSSSMTSPHAAQDLVDLDAVSWQMSDKTASNIIRTKLFYGIPPQVQEPVLLERGQVYRMDCFLDVKQITEMIDGRRVTRATLFEGEVPHAGHLGFGIIGAELTEPAIVQNLKIHKMTQQEMNQTLAQFLA